MLFSINWPKSNAWLPLLLDSLGNMYIVITSFPVDDIINFETDLNFLIKAFSYITKNVTTKI